MELFERLHDVHERWDVLRHPFYRRWSQGDLEREELAFYAGEYRHAVIALAHATAAAGRVAAPERRGELEQHAAEESEHIELWDDFAGALGARTDRVPLATTAACVEAWTGGEAMLERLAVLYAVESAQPAISRTKLHGLVAHYGMAGDARATAYFVLHAERDREHAAHSRLLIEEELDSSDPDRLLDLAETALQANWCLLDGVEGRLAASG